MPSDPTFPGGLRRRLLHGLGATALGPVVTAAVQLGAVPLLLTTWGASKYGEWLVISAIPTYFGISDLGFGDASGSDMTVRVAAGDREGALCTLQSSWVLLTGVSLAALVVAAPIICLVPWFRLLHISSLPDHDASIVVLLLTAYMLASQQTGVLESGYRCEGNYSAGTLYANLIRLLEAVAATVVAILTGSFIAVAFTYFITRCAGSILYWILLRRKSPWLRLGVRQARWARVKELSKPAFGFLVLPAGHALSLQGFTILIGALLGPIAVTSFSTLRTLTRVTSQFVQTIANTIWPELSRSFGAGDLRLARDLHRHTYRVGVAAACLISLFLWFTGPAFYQLWMQRRVVFHSSCFHVLLFVTVANSMWYVSSIVPMSTNRHHQLALIYFALTAASLGVAYLLANSLGIVGPAIALLLIEFGMCWVVLRAALSQLDDQFYDFVSALLHPVRWLPWKAPYIEEVPNPAAACAVDNQPKSILIDPIN